MKTWLMAVAMVLAGIAIEAPGVQAADNPLAGTWVLVAADKLLPDGTRVHDYGDAPNGRLMIDVAGHYSVQIYDTARPKFASGDKLKGTEDEYRMASLGASVHFGALTVDEGAHTLTLDIEASTYPNQEHTRQVRIYQLDGDVLSYRVPPRPDGSVPVSAWQRVK